MAKKVRRSQPFMDTFLDTPLVNQDVYPEFVKNSKKVPMDSMFDVPIPKTPKRRR